MVTLAKEQKYKHVRLFTETHRELNKFKKLYELQDGKDYSMDDVINLLMRDRVEKPFMIPITKDKKEAIEYSKSQLE